MSKIITSKKINPQRIAYLKKQSDSRFTINAGSELDSGGDMWFETQASNVKDARSIFKYFTERYQKMISGKISFEVFHENVNDKDMYILDDSQMENYD